MKILEFNDQNIENYEEKFNEIANHLLNESLLMVADIPHKICEIEFYFYNKDHDDPFTHRDKEQQTNGNWYFHRQNGGSYKGGTFKGLDITFGSQNSFGGILIRSIYIENMLLEGPCKIVDYILDKCGYKSIGEFVECTKVKKIGEKSCLYITKDTNPRNERIYKGPRVGLSLKKISKKYEYYLMKNYRFLTNIKNIKKYKNSLIINLIKDGLDNDSIYELSNATKKTIESYRNIMSSPRKKIENFHKKNLTSGDIIELLKIF